VLWTTSVSHGLIHVYELSIPALLLLIQAEFGTGDFAMGRVVTLYGLFFGLGALPAGMLVDRHGSRLLLVLCVWGAALSLGVMALSRSMTMFTVGAGCMGLCLSLYHPAGTALISRAMPLSGGVFAIHGMVGNLGVAGSSLVAGSLGALFGWRFSLGVLALAGIAVGVAVLGLPAVVPGGVRSRSSGCGRWAFALMLVAAAFMGMVYRGMTTFLPKFFATSYADTVAAGTAVGGLLTTFCLLAGLIGMYVAGRLVDGGMKPVRAFLLGALGQVPFLLLLGISGVRLLVPLTMAVAFFHFFTQPPGNHMVADFTPPRLRGLSYGIYFFVGFGAGSLGASLGGWVSERVGLVYTFPVLAAAAVPAIVAVTILNLRQLTRGSDLARSASAPGRQ
jgi:MFS family permease